MKAAPPDKIQSVAFTRILQYDTTIRGTNHPLSIHAAIFGFISAESCFDKIYVLVDDTDSPAFTFCVTIQNHSPYNVENFKSKVDFDGDFPEAEQFLTLIGRYDREIGKLISHFEKCREDTMIVYFGDHFPALPDSYWEYDTGISRPDEDYDTRQMYYASPFFV